MSPFTCPKSANFNALRSQNLHQPAPPANGFACTSIHPSFLSVNPLNDAAVLHSECPSNNRCLVALHGPKKSRLSSYPPSRGVNQLRSQSAGVGSTMSTKRHPSPPRVPTHSCQVGASTLAQGPLRKRGGREAQQLMVLPQVMALRYLSFDGLPKKQRMDDRPFP